jgi:murein DD-endopeptidase MepM/ murein hydrolase activator NlpD
VLLALLLTVPAADASAALARRPHSIPVGLGPPIAQVPVLPSYRWPLDGRPVVTRRFEPPPQRWLAGHRGVDLAGDVGSTVRAAGAGTVVFSGMIAGRGVVSVAHVGGLRTTYEPVHPTVRAGQAVGVGDPIAMLVGAHPGCPVAACVHWGLRQGEVYLDPLTLLGVGRLRLLPLESAQESG